MNSPTIDDLAAYLNGSGESSKLRKLLDMHPLYLEFSTQARNAIASAGIQTLGDLVYARSYLAEVRNCGDETLAEIRQGLQSMSLDFKSSAETFEEFCALRRFRDRVTIVLRVASLVEADPKLKATAEKLF